MKTQNIIFIVIAIVFLMTFFFKTIPIPVENIEGIKDTDNFIFGGFYFTSLLYELNVGNYLSVYYLCFAFSVLTLGNYFYNRTY